MCDSRRLGVYCSSPLAVVDDEAPRYHRCAIHFYRHRNSQMICRNKGMQTMQHVSSIRDGISVITQIRQRGILLALHWLCCILKDERGNYICSSTARHPVNKKWITNCNCTCVVCREIWLAALADGQMDVLRLTCAGEDWLVAFSREQRTGLDLSWTVIQVHRGSCRNTRPIFALHTGADQIRNTAINQNADVLWQKQI